jgi:hypothetical protein
LSIHEGRDHWQEWLKNQLQEVEVLPRKEYLEESMQVLLAALHEERRKVRFRKRIRRTLEGLAVAVAAVAIIYMAPQLNNLLQGDGSTALEQGPAGETGEQIGIMGKTDDTAVEKNPAVETVENEQFRVLLPTSSPLKVGTEFEVTGEVKQEPVKDSQEHLRYEVEDGHNILASGTLPSVGEGTGWQPFVLKVKLEQKPTSPNGLLILYTNQAGQRSNELTIPLQFVEQQGSPDAAGKNNMSAPLPPAEEAYPVQSVRVVDQRGEDWEFAAYFQSLQKAVKERDVSALKKAMSPEIYLSYGGKKGYEDLEEMWDLKTNPKGSPIWSELEKALKYGAKKEGDYFRAPAVELPANTDEYRARAIVGSNVNVRSAPSMDGKVIEQVSNLLVRMPKDLTKYDKPGWKAVILPSGKPGYVAAEYVVDPLGYRAMFGKVNGKWTMITWIAGD